MSTNIKYETLFYHNCQDKTSHCEVDTIEGPRFSCEICGTIADSENIGPD